MEVGAGVQSKLKTAKAALRLTSMPVTKMCALDASSTTRNSYTHKQRSHCQK